MSCLNLYKIDDDKIDSFYQELTKKMKLFKTIVINKETSNGKTETFSLSLYNTNHKRKKEPEWNWVLAAFGESTFEVESNPYAAIVVEKEDSSTYAVAFGNAFFLIHKFCDKDFGFTFARKLSFQGIKTTTLLTPNSKRNKIVNTYIDYNELEFDSGESFAKIKATAILPENFTLFKPTIEIGSSIKFVTNENSLDQLINIILYVENVMSHEIDKLQIPLFSKIKDKEYIKYLNQRMVDNVKDNPDIIIPELNIIGATEVFNRNDSEFILKYKRQKKQVSCLTDIELKEFCNENKWDYSSVVLDIAVISLIHGDPVSTKYIRDMIEYTDDREKCLLYEGIWYKYNDDYLNYLKNSLEEIPAEYHPKYDFSKDEYNEFIESIYFEEKNSPDYKGKSKPQILESLRKKYYAERAFNILRNQKDGFTNLDRSHQQVGSARIEPMDLYKDGIMYTVKIGSSSSKLCYAVDQSLQTMKLYKYNMLTNAPKIDTVCIWIVLENKEHIEDANGKPNINLLDMLTFKNKLDSWKKEVRLQGLQPLIYVNYRTK